MLRIPATKVIGDPVAEDFKAFWKIYIEAFPPEQRRPEAAQKDCLRNTAFSLLAIMNKKTVVGCLSFWDLGTFMYIEHLAIDKRLRGKGLGSKVLSDFLHAQIQLVVLESDPLNPSDSISAHRLNFYTKLGFVQNPQTYRQSPFAQDQPAVPAVLLSHPRSIKNNTEFAAISDAISTVAHAY